MPDQDSQPKGASSPPSPERAALPAPPARAALPAPPARPALPAPKGGGGGPGPGPAPGQEQGQASGQGQDGHEQPRKPLARGTIILLLALLALIFLGILIIGTLIRLFHKHELRKRSQEAEVPTVTVVHPGGEASDTLVLPGRLQAWSQAPIYARTTGYLRSFYVDIGQPVKAGQLLARIDSPEVDQQLIEAKATLQTALAQEHLAAISANRWNRLIGEGAVPAQEVDERRGTLATSIATVRQDTAEVRRLQELTGFERVVAPFSGIVTSRSTDIGTLIVASAQASQPLFTIVDVSRLRLYVSVPQSYVGRMRTGMAAHFVVPDHPHQEFTTVVDHASEAVDPVNGSMLLQLVYNNRAGDLKPGAYAQVTFTFTPPTDDTGPRQQPRATSVARIPASSLLFRREGTSVAIADAQGRVRIQRIAIQTDFGKELAVEGVGPNDLVIDNPADDLETGDRVRPTLSKPGAGQGQGQDGKGGEPGGAGGTDTKSGPDAKPDAKKSPSKSDAGPGHGTITGSAKDSPGSSGAAASTHEINPNTGVNRGADSGAAFGKNTGQGSDAGPNADKDVGTSPPPGTNASAGADAGAHSRSKGG